MQADEAGSVLFLEVAADRILHLLLEFVERFRLSANGMAESLRFEPPSSDSCTAKIISLCDILKPRIDRIPPSAGGNGCFDRWKRTAG